MISPTAGSIWIPITSTRKSLRPLKRYFASAIAARNESTIASSTEKPTMITLFFASVQKYGRLTASRKCWSVGLQGTQVGLRPLISSVGLNAVEIIQ